MMTRDEYMVRAEILHNERLMLVLKLQTAETADERVEAWQALGEWSQRMGRLNRERPIDVIREMETERGLR